MLKIANKKIASVIVVYWLLLLYVLAALLWWYIALNRLNNQNIALQISSLHANETGYQQQLAAIYDSLKRKQHQYIGEGITFFVVIIIAAYFVFKATMKQIKLSAMQQNFMMAVTHELKTPVAVIKLNAETLKRHNLPAQHQQNILQETIVETDRLNDLINNILIAFQLEKHQAFSNKETTNFYSIIEQSVNEFKVRFSERAINFIFDSNEVEMFAEPLLIRLFVNNLIDNAIKYSDKNSSITIHLNHQNKQIIFCVKDEGKGIDEEEKKKIFDKFYRIGNEENRQTKGTGLGLYLCKKIAQQHNAKIIVSNNKPTGTIFTTTFNT